MAGKAKPTIRDVAAAAAVYPSTVSAVLGGKTYMRISRARRAKVHRIAAELGYKPNRQAVGLRRSVLPVIGVFLPDESSYLGYDLVAGLSEGANELELPISFHFGLTLDAYHQFIDSAIDRRNTAIITYDPLEWKGSDSKEVVQKLAAYRDAGGRITSINPHTPTMMGYPSVGMDDQEGGRLAAEHLASRGCRLALALGYAGRIFQLRLRGFRNRLAECGLPFAVIESQGVPRFSVAHLAEELDRRLADAPRPVGLFCSHSRQAQAVVGYALDRQLALGRAVHVVAYDRGPAWGEYRPLPRVIQPFREMGRIAARWQAEMLADKTPTPLWLKPQLVVPKEGDENETFA